MRSKVAIKLLLTLPTVLILFHISFRSFVHRRTFYSEISTTLRNVENVVLPRAHCAHPRYFGRVPVHLKLSTIENLHLRLPNMTLGGHWTPPHCRARQRVAVLITFHDRKEHLQILLPQLHRFLQRQLTEYRVFLIEPVPANGTFNKAKLYNVGFLEATRIGDFDCFILHDVDMIPFDTRNLYECSTQPVHLSAAIDKFRYKLPYDDIFGGVIAVTPEMFRAANGFSNHYWGWGGEDDELRMRLQRRGWNVTRPPLAVARFRMIPHEHDPHNPKNPCHDELPFASAPNQERDGLSTIRYRLKDVLWEPLFTHILVDLMEAETRKLYDSVYGKVPCKPRPTKFYPEIRADDETFVEEF